MASGIVVDRVSIRYSDSSGNEVVACDDLQLEIEPGEFTVLVGRSGCGKTSLLNAIDGLVSVTTGAITIDGKNTAEPSTARAMVFQSPRLLPWRRIVDNVCLGIEG
ncbi:MAG: transporter related protein, partial [Cryobacterium sp.]|nr:transporter related protein [Cryobacterium sp.]